MEKLADRVTWDRTATGIQVVIPARMGWAILFFAVWLAGWTIAGKSVWHQAFPDRDMSHVVWFSALWMVGWAIGECFVTSAILWALGGQTILRLDPRVLDFERNLFGIRLNRRSIPTSEVRNLRYTQATRKGRSYQESAICFETGDKTIRLGGGISDAEALAVIDKMLGVYQFPKERALEYLDLSR